MFNWNHSTLPAAVASHIETLWNCESAEAHERARIAALLHDEVGQCVAVIGLALDRLADISKGDGQPPHIDDIRRALMRLDRSWREAVSRPEPPQAPDMLPALARLCREAEREMHLHCSLQVASDAAPPTGTGARVLLHGMRELLLNVRKHADSPYVNVSLDSYGPWVEVAVRDHGSKPLESVTERRLMRGFGLLNLKRELRAVGGDIRVDAVAPGRRVRLRVPTLQAVHGEGASQ